MAFFQVVLLGTLVQTGVGLIHSVNKPIASTLQDSGKTMPGRAPTIVATCMLLVALFMASKFGLVTLIAKGYGIVTFGFIVVLVVPILTIGIYRIIRGL